MVTDCGDGKEERVELPIDDDMPAHDSRN